jgi:beta-lactamase class A
MHVLRGVEDGKAFRAGLSNTTTARALMRLLEAIGLREAADAASCEAMERVLQGQQFRDGIPAGVPPGVPVANKTGTINRLHHDAAIVRAPRPFVLVVLTRGLESEAESDALIAELTRLLYAATQPPG